MGDSNDKNTGTWKLSVDSLLVNNDKLSIEDKNVSNILIAMRDSMISAENDEGSSYSDSSEEIALKEEDSYSPKRSKRKKRAYSTDITDNEREMIIRSVIEDKTPYRTVAKMYGRNHSTVFRIVKRFKETGDISSSDSRKGRRHRLLDESQWLWIINYAESKPSSTLSLLKDVIHRKYKVKVSETTLSRNLRRLRKKNENVSPIEST